MFILFIIIILFVILIQVSSSSNHVNYISKYGFSSIVIPLGYILFTALAFFVILKIPVEMRYKPTIDEKESISKLEGIVRGLGEAFHILVVFFYRFFGFLLLTFIIQFISLRFIKKKSLARGIINSLWINGFLIAIIMMFIIKN
jgi:hypothetical protein